MRERLKAVLFILAIPVIALVAAEGLKAHANSEFRSAVAREFKNADPAALERLDLSIVCEEADGALARSCGDFYALELLSMGAQASGSAGMVLWLGIAVAGGLARKSRTILLTTFSIGLRITIFATTALIALNGLLAVSTIWLVESTFSNTIHSGLIFGIVVGACVGIVGMVKSAFAAVTEVKTAVVGELLRRSTDQRLYSRVDQLAEALGALPPDNIVVGLDTNFFVTESRVICSGNQVAGRTLYCSLPLSRILSEAEFDAVIGHELGHFKGEDTHFSQRFYPIYRGTANSLAILQGAGAEGVRAVALLPAVAILSYLFEAFSIAESSHSREREFEADHHGASITSPDAMASALVKVHAFAPYWQSVQTRSIDLAREGKAFVNISESFVEVVRSVAAVDVFDGIGGTHTFHPTDSHPPLDARLASLGFELRDIESVALEIDPSRPAISAIDRAVDIEMEVGDIYQALIATRAGVASPQTTEDDA